MMSERTCLGACPNGELFCHLLVIPRCQPRHRIGAKLRAADRIFSLMICEILMERRDDEGVSSNPGYKPVADL